MVAGIVGSNRYSAFDRTQHICQAMNSSDRAFSINNSVHAAFPLNVCIGGYIAINEFTRSAYR